MKRIRVGGAEIEYTPAGCVTRYAEGIEWGAHPHDTPHYREITERCGYGADTLAYCREHEVCHQIVPLWVLGWPQSGVIRALALGVAVVPWIATAEEIAVQTFQRWIRAHERPIVGGVDWDGLKGRALALLDA